MPPERPPHDSNHVQWFADEVQPHEPALRTYLRNRFPKERDVDDVVQESFLPLWKVRTGRQVRFAKALLFKVARHLVIDLARRRKTFPEDAVRDLDVQNVIEEGSSVVDVVSLREKTRLLAEAIDSLPARCREIVILRKLRSMPQREVALHLGLSEKTVEAHVNRGIRRCEEYLRKRGVHHYYMDESH